MRRRCLLPVGLAAPAALGALGATLFTGVFDPDLTPQPQAEASYAEAEAAIDAALARDASETLTPEAASRALLTGRRTPTAVLIFHGYTSVPAQFRIIAQAYRDSGCNVWVPRLPFHGSVDKLTTDFSRLTAEELRAFADRNVDLAAGLGDAVLVIGYSAGGALALWSGFARPEVTRTVLISPLLQPLGYPAWLIPPLIRLLRLLPWDVYQWWDPALRERNVAGYSYPRLSLRGLGAFLSLTRWVADRSEPPPTSDVLLIRNDGDQRLDSAFNEAFLTRLVPPARLSVFRIPASAGLLHGFVTPEPFSEGYANVTESYRYLSEALGIPLPDPKETE